jgi:hypothetical protein
MLLWLYGFMVNSNDIIAIVLDDDDAEVDVAW